MNERLKEFYTRDRGPGSITATVIRLALSASEALAAHNNRAAEKRGEPFGCVC